ncbi:MAG TPA: hypothetical protein PLG15_04055 [Candidatus Gastranaerophilaceae bacterium]|nr:hypothetical protein [Candidatus Gastranaerophilaceae bacterium]HPT41539.1 hypothetical protein [Candidatus Gastranaerophilaceae bacterium]
MQINRVNSPSFGTKIPTINAIELVVGRSLTYDGIEPAMQCAEKIIGKLNECTIDIPYIISCCKEVLIKQFPVLEKVEADANRFFKCRHSASSIFDWVNNQVKIIGAKELDVVPIKTTSGPADVVKALRMIF